MPGFIRSRMPAVLPAVLLLAAVLSGGLARAENEGQDDLDKATEAKLSASTFGDLAEVIQLAESALEKGLDEDNSTFATNLLVSTLIQRGTALGERIFRRSPPDARWPQFRHVALADLEKAVKLSPKQPMALLLIARLNFLPDGDRRRAAETLNSAIDLLADEPKQRAAALILRAAIEEDAQKQLADLDEAIRLQPDHGPAHEARALVLAGLKQYDEALASLDKAAKLRPESPSPLMLKARIHVQQKDLKAALADLEQAEKIAPKSMAVLLLRAAVYEEMNEKNQALAELDRALVISPDMPAAIRLRAVLLADAGKIDEAVAELERLRALRPGDKLTLFQLGMLYSAGKQYDKAIETYSTILADVSDSWAALRGRGDALLTLGKQTEALADYERTLKLRPKNSGVLNNLAWLLATSPDEKLRDGQRAITLAMEACKLTEYKQAHILSTLAAAYAETGDFASAVKWIEKGLEIADEKMKEPLEKELESYRAEKPWRELLSGD